MAPDDLKRAAVPVSALLVGAVRPMGPRDTPTGMAKHRVSGRIWLGREGLSGDGHGDTKNHGGPEKAVHHYPFEHYAHWRREFGEGDLLAGPGAFGENISTLGLTEAEVAIGDSFRLGEAVVQVSQGRQPCWKLNLRFGLSDMAHRVQASGRTGWYYRVLREGHVAEGDTIELVERAHPDWTLMRLWRAFYIDTMNLDELAAIVALTCLSAGWRRHAERRISSGKLEDWTRRLTMPSDATG